MAKSPRDTITPLVWEHKGIAAQLEKVRNQVFESPNPSPSRLQGSIGRLDSLMKAHFRIEETTLYVPLKLRLGRNSPVDAMTEEHRLIRQAVGQLLSALAQYIRNRRDIDDLQSRFQSLQKDIGRHIEKEEKILFWLADLNL